MGLVANRVKLHGNESKNPRCSKYNDDVIQFYFGCTLGEQLLRQTNNLGRTLQDSSTSAAQGNRLAQDVIKTLLDRPDTSLSLFLFGILQSKTTEIQTIEYPMLPRKK